MHVFNRIAVAAAATASAAIFVALALPAHADTAAQSGDAVIVGSDTVQNAVDFALDGAPGVTGGYNSSGNLNRGVNIDATGDANGRATYDGTCGTVSATTGVGTNCDSTTNQTANTLAGSVVLRAGTKPVVRPNGSGAGIQALVLDANSSYEGLPAGSIQIARASRLPKTLAGSGEADACGTGTACGGLHVYQIATDDLALAHVSSGYDGPASLSTAELVKIYTCVYTSWNQIPGNTGGSANTIHPLIPQSGSGTRNFFLADLQSANGGTAITPGTCVRNVQEHDPSGIYTDPTPKDAIEPFSTGKLTLINSGYFVNGVSNTANKAYQPNYLVAPTTGTAPDGTAAYDSTRGLYLVIRQPDLGSTTPFQPGSALNYVKALITSGASAVRSSAGQSEIAAAGFTPAYADCGVNPSAC